jgi:hypothetical protein
MNRRRIARRRGIGLLEVVISLTLSTVLLYVMVQWLIATAALSQASSENSATVRDSVRVLTVFEQDVAAARSCDGDLGLPVVDLTSSGVGLYRDVDQDGLVDLVSWDFSAGLVRRAVLVGDGDCSFDTGSRAWVTVSDLLAPYGPSEPALTAVIDGALLAEFPDCTDLADCPLDGLYLDLRLVTPDGGVELTGAKTALFTPYWTQR